MNGMKRQRVRLTRPLPLYAAKNHDGTHDLQLFGDRPEEREHHTVTAPEPRAGETEDAEGGEEGREAMWPSPPRGTYFFFFAAVFFAGFFAAAFFVAMSPSPPSMSE